MDDVDLRRGMEKEHKYKSFPIQVCTLDQTISQSVVRYGWASIMMLALAAVNTSPPTVDVLSFWCTVWFGGNTSLDRIAFLSGSAPGFTPRSQDSVPHIRSGLI
ncbi:hypothetical protein DPMN_037923 [Dreissena polymorpha]|uniref:Uncharacterized protein n=1 Tax=Dreissena polymorpha TaxID=45954 RepID=A0A9D4MBT9_DREPO|nr:hypothetical protein DPMN_037923 [Dreissena polymorpha]